MRLYLIADYHCNNRCRYCANTSSERTRVRRPTSVELLRRLREAGLRGIHTIEWSGGEPTARPRFAEECQAIRALMPMVRLEVLSNARLFSRMEFTRSVAPCLSGVTTAVMGPRDVHDHLSGVAGAYEETIQGLRNLATCGVAIAVKCVITKANVDWLAGFVDFTGREFPEAFAFFSGLELRGRGSTNADELAVRWRVVGPRLEAALDRAARRGREVFVFTTPFCAVDPVYWDRFSTDIDRVVGDLSLLSPSRQRVSPWLPLRCIRTCVMSRRCFWPWMPYVRRFGMRELRPIRGARRSAREG